MDIKLYQSIDTDVKKYYSGPGLWYVTENEPLQILQMIITFLNVYILRLFKMVITVSGLNILHWLLSSTYVTLTSIKLTTIHGTLISHKEHIVLRSQCGTFKFGYYQ